MTIQEVADAIPTKVIKDDYGYPVIQGKRGNIHEDGSGFSLFVGFKTKAVLGRCHEVIAPFCIRKQNGDTEAVYFFSSASPEQLQSLRGLCQFRKKKQYSEEQMDALKERGLKLAEKLKDWRSVSKTEGEDKALENDESDFEEDEDSDVENNTDDF